MRFLSLASELSQCGVFITALGGVPEVLYRPYPTVHYGVPYWAISLYPPRARDSSLLYST